MSAREIAVLVLLVLTVALVLVCAVGVMVMRDPFQRLHFIAPPATLSAGFLTVAVLLETKSAQATLKTAFVAVLLLLVNGVVTHATARAARIRARGDWSPREDEDVPFVDGDGGAP